MTTPLVIRQNGIEFEARPVLTNQPMDKPQWSHVKVFDHAELFINGVAVSREEFLAAARDAHLPGDPALVRLEDVAATSAEILA